LYSGYAEGVMDLVEKRSLNNLVGILPSLTDEEIENIKNERISKQ
jgi:hypothetical protein